MIKIYGRNQPNYLFNITYIYSNFMPIKELEQGSTAINCWVSYSYAPRM